MIKQILVMINMMKLMMKVVMIIIMLSMKMKINNSADGDDNLIMVKMMTEVILWR